MTEANAERLAASLCRMRGAALKVGQMLSLADDKHLPPVVRLLRRVLYAFSCMYSLPSATQRRCCARARPHTTRQERCCRCHVVVLSVVCLWQVARALERVRAQADVMPKQQLYGVLREQLGDDWRSKFLEFDDAPFAAASIGQVGPT